MSINRENFGCRYIVAAFTYNDELLYESFDSFSDAATQILYWLSSGYEISFYTNVISFASQEE